MTLILFALAFGLLFMFAVCMQQRRFEIVALRADEIGARNPAGASKGIS